jgi:hypothetical protein
MLTEAQAHKMADIFKGAGACPWHSGGGHWLVRFDRPDGSFVTLDDQSIGEFTGDDDSTKDEGTYIYFAAAV